MFEVIVFGLPDTEVMPCTLKYNGFARCTILIKPGSSVSPWACRLPESSSKANNILFFIFNPFAEDVFGFQVAHSIQAT